MSLTLQFVRSFIKEPNMLRYSRLLREIGMAGKFKAYLLPLFHQLCIKIMSKYRFNNKWFMNFDMFMVFCNYNFILYGKVIFGICF